MTKNIRIVACAILGIIAASAFYLVVPITTAFIASHIFVCLAIICGARTSIGFGRFNAKSVAGVSYIVQAIGYLVLCVAFSIIACLWLTGKWTIVGHIVIFVLYLILTILSTVGSDYINKLDSKHSEHRAEFEKEKAEYWKK